jgi:S-DNA-T family DNA segregation ATPase FtsK/SpoIIIE
MIVLPLVAAVVAFGIAAAVGTGDPPFAILAFGLLGPGMAVWNWSDDRRSGRKDFVAASEKYAEQLARTAEAASQHRASLASWRAWSTPPTTELIGLAGSWSAALWDRQPEHPDFLHLRVGAGDLAVPRRITVAEHGDRDQVARALAVQRDFAVDVDSPVAVALRDEAVLGIVGGGAEDRRSLARSLVLQVLARHSPNDVVVACLAPEDWTWLTWAPHCTPSGETRPLVGRDQATDEVVLAWLEALIAQRSSVARGASRAAFHTVLVIETPVTCSPTRLTTLLGSARAAGMSVIALAAERAELPSSTSVVITVGTTSGLQRTSGEPPLVLRSVEAATVSDALSVARSLAPLVDPSTSTAASVPDRVGLFELLGSEVLDDAEILARWERGARDLALGHLRGEVGVSGSGPVVLDLGNDGDGPHGLVGGSPGSGKSEFLQTLVLSLASHYGPTDLNFLFIDFKGGLTFQDLIRLPHAVGMVRNLDGALALRAKRSLQAETRRRQRVLQQYGAVNLSDLRKRAPEVVLPALVLIVDEFAELAQKLPEFLDGIVEVAQTGRALGIHLLLATQSPGNSVSRNIQNCSKYRISFRLADSSASSEILGKGRDASLLPNHPGRGLFLDGTGKTHEFQSAWAGGRTNIDDEPVATAHTLYESRRRSATASGPTDLERAVDALLAAFGRSGLPAAQRPWVEPLPIVIPVDALASAQSTEMSDASSHRACIGVADLPDEQRQAPYFWDLATNQNLLVVGDAGSGKTTALRTAAAVFAQQYRSDEVLLLGIDAAAGGLGSIKELPNCVGVVNTTDTVSLRRALAHLRRTVNRNREQVGSVGSLRTFREHSGISLPDTIVLIDGFEHVLAVLEMLDGGTYQAELLQLVADGPAMGVHFIIATEQPQRIPLAVANAVPERLVLRMRSREGSYAFDLRADLSELPNGRAISTRTRDEVQIAALGDASQGSLMATDAVAQQERLRRLGVALGQAGRTPVAGLPQAPKVLVRGSLEVSQAPADHGRLVVGIDDLFSEPIGIDLRAVPTLVVAGPDMSGRTNVLEWVRLALSSTAPVRSMYISGRGSNPRLQGWTNTFLDPWDSLEALETLAAERASVRLDAIDTLVAIDDADDLIDSNPIGARPEEMQAIKRFSTALDTLLRAGRTSGVVVVLAGRMSTLTRASGWALRMRQNQQAILLMPPTLAGINTDLIFNVTLPRRNDYVPTPGHGVLVRRAVTDLVQVVYAGDSVTLPS